MGTFTKLSPPVRSSHRHLVLALQEVQAKSAELGGEVAVGGLGHGLTRPLQRIDVTGHVACAYIRLLEVLEGREP